MLAYSVSHRPDRTRGLERDTRSLRRPTREPRRAGSGVARPPILSSLELAPDFRCQFLVLVEEVPVGLRLTRVMLPDG